MSDHRLGIKLGYRRMDDFLIGTGTAFGIFDQRPTWMRIVEYLFPIHFVAVPDSKEQGN